MRVVFMGSPEFAVPSLCLVATHHEVVWVVTQPDRPAGRGRDMAAPAVKRAALELALPVGQPASVRDAAFAEALRGYAPDVLVVVAYGRILPQAVLDVAPKGAWNVHASLLPELRGAAPIQWSVIRGYARTGVSVMRMEAGLDTGPVAARKEISIEETDTAGTLAARLAPLGAELLVAVLDDVERGTVQTVAQDHTLATLAPPLLKSDGALDFKLPAAQVAARARGVDPWPGAFAALGSARVKMFGVRAQEAVGEPGTVLAIESKGAIVACAQGAIRVTEVQFPGKTRMPADVAARGRLLRVGMRFG